MNKLLLYRIVLFLLIFVNLLIPESRAQQREVIPLDSWRFARGEHEKAPAVLFDDTAWKTVNVPHDWAITGPFDKTIDQQTVRITQNNEKSATEKTGRTGALPFTGTGWYRTRLPITNAAPNERVLLTFDGAMSHAQVYVNGQKVGERPYGYVYFYFDITGYLQEGENVVAVRLHNQEFSSRWYPGAGLYRKVQVIRKHKDGFKHWGQIIQTPLVTDSVARITIQSEIHGENAVLKTTVFDAEGKQVATNRVGRLYGKSFYQNIQLKNPRRWSPDHPYLYTAQMELYQNGKRIDREEIPFGIRSIEYSAENGFQLNGTPMKFKGVCLHHDLGPIGAAVNKSAIRRRLTILKDLGANAIRSAHNMPSMELLELCDEMGFLVVAESFDEWKKPKVKNGYNQYFDEWAEQDIKNLVRATKNHPSIVMWSAGNEVPDQYGFDGVKRLHRLQRVFHREDPTRPVTVGMDRVEAVMKNGFGAILDVPGLNYRVHLYEKAQEQFPQGFILGSETASTVSSRGVYHFPVKKGAGVTHTDLQSSSYDLEYCNWSNIPEVDFEMQDDKDWVLGEFVWTGFDYLGEPTPYDNYWPARSSYFGLIDLAGLPKDRYYLYRSRWNTEDETLHILPHWNWEGREGERTPVFVYTSYHKAELFVNGESQGIREKNDSTLLTRYRLMWNDIIYEPGEVKVVALDENNQPVAEERVQTAGSPYAIQLEADRTTIKANGDDLSFVTATIVDKNGNPCPKAINQLEFAVTGAGTFRAVCNGDPTSLELFHQPTMKAFSGKLVVLVQSTNQPGEMELSVTGENLKENTIRLGSE